VSRLDKEIMTARKSIVSSERDIESALRKIKECDHERKDLETNIAEANAVANATGDDEESRKVEHFIRISSRHCNIFSIRITESRLNLKSF
jgi:hypothetical protein